MSHFKAQGKVSVGMQIYMFSFCVVFHICILAVFGVQQLDFKQVLNLIEVNRYTTLLFTNSGSVRFFFFRRRIN